MLRRVVVCATVLAALAAAAPAAHARLQATIRWASHGVPHILAKDWAGLGYGYGSALASQTLCTIADSYVTVRAQRSRFFGPDASWKFHGNGTTNNNLNSDFFFQRIIDAKTVEGLIAQPPPAGPLPQVKEIVRGYVAGYNRQLRTSGGGTDPACKGKPWVTPITRMDVYRRFYQLALLASQAVAIDGIGGAQPPSPDVGGLPGSESGVSGAQLRDLQELKTKLPLGGIGSNAIALGKDATASGRGLLLGNPHFPWDGSERFFQSQLTIPGKIDVAGASLLGVPLILIGHTRKMAWSHTVSTAFRFTPFELKLVPGSPTTYLYDGAPKEMTKQEVTVQVPGASGELEPVTRTLYSTVQGPVLTGVLNLPLFPWTPAVAYAMGDVNAANFRYLNHFFAVDRAQSTDRLHRILNRYQGIPWVNTIAADSAGKAFYADIGAVPNVPDDLAAQCVNGALGLVAQGLLGLPILDGTTSSCAWRDDPDAAAPGIIGPAKMPFLFRSDYVTNSNDSYWLSNPLEPLTGFARIIGAEGTTRSLRTRNGLTMVADQLAAGRFTLRMLRDLVFNNRQYAGVLFRDQLVGMCEANPTITSPTNGPVDVSAACPILAAWDLNDDLESKGAALFRRFAARVLGSATPGVSTANPYATPFSAEDPVNTPRDLKTGDATVQAALADAVSDLQAAGIPLDSGMRGFQYEQRGDEQIPIHGGPGTLGVFNALNATWTAGKGYADVPHGSSFVQTVQLTKGCPRSYSILTYSQSTDPTSPYYSDQTRQYSEKRWNPMRFCAKQLRKDPNLRVQKIRQPPRRSASGR